MKPPLVTIRRAHDVVGVLVGDRPPFAGYVVLWPLGAPRWATYSVPARDVVPVQPGLFP